MEKATFGAGCFWGVEEAFAKIPGVLETAAGYSGGHRDSPSYEDVCSNETGHAEVVEITFDSGQVSYEQLLELFFKIHDPTQPNRQGADLGTQYRSTIFVHSEEQRRIAEATVASLEAAKAFRRSIVTAIEPAATFWRAEDYHQRYIEKRGRGWGPVASGFPKVF
jgi:peptide-methionine (S)-S-oxide reductase